MLLSAFIDAPLLERGNINYSPNPAKSAWFLLWIQELVSYSIYNIYLLLLLLLFYILLPRIRGKGRTYLAMWFPNDDRFIAFLTIVIYVGILVLTVIAHFFRGPDWHIKF